MRIVPCNLGVGIVGSNGPLMRAFVRIAASVPSSEWIAAIRRHGTRDEFRVFGDFVERKNMEVPAYKKYVAEVFGTFVLTFFGCGSAVVAGATLGTLGIAFSFGLSIVAMAFVIGNVSGCHINPAVSLGLFLDKRLSAQDLLGYWVSQFLGGLLAAALLFAVVCMYGGDVLVTGLGCNGFESASSVNLSMGGAIIVEIVLTCIFVLSVLGSTANEKTAAYAGIIIGLTLVFVHIMGIPLTGTSVNPARSFGPAVLMAIAGDSFALSQAWVFIVAPLVGAALAAGIFRFFKVEK